MVNETHTLLVILFVISVSTTLYACLEVWTWKRKRHLDENLPEPRVVVNKSALPAESVLPMNPISFYEQPMPMKPKVLSFDNLLTDEDRQFLDSLSVKP